MATTISVPYQNLTSTDAISESWDSQNGPQATVKFKCAWSDRYQLARDLMGTWTGTPPSTVTRVPPFQYPDSPNLFCSAIQSIEPFGKPTLWTSTGLGWVTRSKAIVTATFSVPQWQFDGGDAYTKITFGSSAEFLTVPDTAWIFASDSSPASSSVGLLIPQMEITLERNRLPFLPIAAMQACQGKVNSAAFYIADVAFAAGYLLFASGQSSYQVDATGNTAFSQEYKFLYRAQPWNKYLRPDGTGFDSVTDRSGNPPYASADFTQLP